MQVKESKTNWHFRISIVKSILRIIAGIALCNGLLIPSKECPRQLLDDIYKYFEERNEDEGYAEAQ